MFKEWVSFIEKYFKHIRIMRAHFSSFFWILNTYFLMNERIVKAILKNMFQMSTLYIIDFKRPTTIFVAGLLNNYLNKSE